MFHALQPYQTITYARSPSATLPEPLNTLIWRAGRASAAGQLRRGPLTAPAAVPSAAVALSATRSAARRLASASEAAAAAAAVSTAAARRALASRRAAASAASRACARVLWLQHLCNAST